MSVSLVIDGDNYVHAMWHGSQGQTDAVFYLRDLVMCYRHNFGATALLCFDPPGATWRSLIYPDYKGQRGPKDEGLVRQLAEAQEWAKNVGLLCPGYAGYEADDLIAMHVAEQRTFHRRTVILSRDKDCRQLLAANEVTILKKASRYHGAWQYEYLTAAQHEAETGVAPAQWADYRAMTGDPSDNWPGAPGIGEKAALAILKHAGSLEAAMAAIDELPISARQRESLRKFDWKRARELMTLRSGISSRETAFQLSFV